MTTSSFEYHWNDHRIRLEGYWSSSWLFLAPVYELWVDDQLADRCGGPRLRPRLSVLIDAPPQPAVLLEVELLSIVGVRPFCRLTLDGEPQSEGYLRVQDVISPVLVLIILLSLSLIAWVGPSVLLNLI